MARPRPRLVHMTALALLCTVRVGPVCGSQAFTFYVVTARRPGPVSYLRGVLDLYYEQRVMEHDGAGLAVIDVDGWTSGEALGQSEGIAGSV